MSDFDEIRWTVADEQAADILRRITIQLVEAGLARDEAKALMLKIDLAVRAWHQERVGQCNE
jgi:hypothetical protein